MIAGVKFDDQHCFDDLGMILAEKEIGMPETQTNYVNIPGRNGPLDFTEAISGGVKYKSRPITLTFISNDYIAKDNWAGLLSRVGNAIHGQRKRIVFDDDPDYYYSGRCEINQFETSWGKQTVVVDCTCDPFKTNTADGTQSL